MPARRLGSAASQAARSFGTSARASAAESSTTSNRVQRAAQVSQAAGQVRGGKVTTGIAGLPVHARPLPELTLIYGETLEALAMLPAGTAYRQAAEAITRHRLQLVERAAQAHGGAEDERAVEAVERELALGQIEEVVAVAEDELSLAHKFLEWRPWEELVEKPAPNQWTYFKVPPSTSNPDPER